MKEGISDKKIIIKDGNFKGFNLGWGFHAEHEGTIDKILRFFETDKYTGKVNVVPDTLYLKNIRIEGTSYTMLVFTAFNLSPSFFNKDGSFSSKLAKAIDIWDYRLKEDGFACSWDSESFAICVTADYYRELLELFEAFKKKNVVIKVGEASDNPFSNCGLIIEIED